MLRLIYLGSKAPISFAYDACRAKLGQSYVDSRLGRALLQLKQIKPDQTRKRSTNQSFVGQGQSRLVEQSGSRRFGARTVS